MGKVVLNCCYGGFGLSPLAIKRFKELSGYEFDEYECDRHDPNLIKVVEELGKEADTSYSRLIIREYDDENFEYWINEYDGIETLMLEAVVSEKKLKECDSIKGIIRYLESLGIKVKETEEDDTEFTYKDYQYCYADEDEDYEE